MAAKPLVWKLIWHPLVVAAILLVPKWLVLQSVTQPMVVDADGLNALARRPEVLEKPGGPRVLTPHPGELGRLIGREKFPAEERETLARDLARRTGAVEARA